MKCIEHIFTSSYCRKLPAQILIPIIAIGILNDVCDKQI